MMKNSSRGYTLIELMIAVGLFALIMMLAAGAYLMMIGISRQAQGITSGIDNLAFALETMTRTIRTSTAYSCAATSDAGDCPSGGGDTFSVVGPGGDAISYWSDGLNIYQTKNGDDVQMTDSSIKNVSLTFYSAGLSSSDTTQARVTIVVSGEVTSGIDKTKVVPFTIETGATMRGSDI